MSMRTKIALYSILCGIVSAGAALLVFFLCSFMGAFAYIPAAVAGTAAAIALSMKSGAAAINREIDDLIDVRDMVRLVSSGEGASYAEPGDYEIAHPFKFIYNELKKIDDGINHLQSELSKHERLFDSIQEGLIIADSDGLIMTINPAAREIFRVPDLKGDMKIEHVIYDVKTLIELGEVTSGNKEFGDTTIRFKGGKTYNVKIYHVSLSGKNDGIIILARDVTAIIAADRIRRDFVANVSHELKTPLTSIRGFSEMLMTGKIEDAAARNQYLALISTEAERLSGLINDVLKLSELEGIALDEGKSRVALSEHAEKALRLVEPLAEKHGVTVTANAKPCVMFANPVRIDELFLNLVDNAVKYNRKNGSVFIETFPDGDDGVLRVSDTGIGIPEEDQPRIFERFYRVDKSRSRESGGTGLGLSIVKHIAELYKGKIHLESEEGKGTSIEIRFPLADAQNPAAQPQGGAYEQHS